MKKWCLFFLICIGKLQDIFFSITKNLNFYILVIN